MNTVLLMIVLLSSLVSGALSKSVLYLGFPFRSHYNYGVAVGKELQKLGHDVTIAVHSADVTMPLLRESGLRQLVYHSLDKLTDNMAEFIIGGDLDAYFKNFTSLYTFEPKRKICDLILRDVDFLGNIKILKPDLILLDSTPLPRMLAIIPYKLGVPFAFIGIGYNPQWARIPMLPAVVPELMYGYSDKMNFGERLENTVTGYLSYIYDPWSYSSAVATYAPEKPYLSLQDLHARADLWLVEAEPVLDYPKPTMPNVKVIGCLSDVTPRPLPRPLQTFMDKAKEGVVIVSFGSMPVDLPRYVTDKLVAAFQKTKFKVVFKSSLRSPEPERLLFQKWLPQYDLLRHPNTRVFVSHCGSNGQSEAVLAEVPTICFPFFAEQPYNAARMAAKGMSVTLKLREFIADELVSAMDAVAGNQTMRTRLKKAAAIIRARKTSAAEEAAFWLDHVMTHGADHLRSSGVYLPLYQFLGLDVLGFFLVVVHVLLFLMYCLGRWLITALFGIGPNKKVKAE